MPCCNLPFPHRHLNARRPLREGEVNVSAIATPIPILGHKADFPKPVVDDIEENEVGEQQPKRVED